MPTGGAALAVELVFGTAEELANLDQRALVGLIGSTEDFLQSGGDVLDGEPPASVWIVFGRVGGSLIE